MALQIKHIVRVSIILLTFSMLAQGLSSCKANKCDCPTFGGHRLKHG
jgi:hypothetical protein